MLLALVAPAFAGLLINEVVYDPSGSDDGYEWVELCNSGSDTVDLTSYQLQSAGTSYTEVYTFLSGTIAPGEYVLVGSGSTLYTGSFSPNLQNGGTESDGLRLVDGSGATVDTVLYDGPNSSGLTEDDGTTPAEGAPAATSGKGLGRWPDCTDTNVSAVDFALYTSGTPMAVNVDPAPDSGGGDDTGTPPDTADCTGSEGVVINELMPNPPGADEGGEWLELRNNGAAGVTLDGWTLEIDTAAFDGSAAYTFPAGTVLAAGGYVVVGAGGLAVTLDMGNAGTSADGVRLACNATPVDTVIYGTTNSDSFLDDTGAVATSLAPKPAEGDSLQRIPDGVDTNASAVDFASGGASPGVANTGSVVSTADCTGSEGVKVNEFSYTTDEEWIELYNGGSTAVLADAWALEFGTSSYSKSVELPAGTVIAPGDYLVIGSAGAATKDLELDMDLGNASSIDALRITCNGDAVDTVAYGSGSNDDGWVDDTGTVATSFAPKAGDGESVARISDGYDTDQSGHDFAVSSTPTPGEPNPTIEPAVCETDGATALKINEFVYDPDGADGGYEWMELVNTGTTELRLDDYVIETAGSDFGEEFRFPSGTRLAAGGFVVVGGENVEEATYTDDGFGLDNGSSDAAGLRVVDCEGTVLDTVLYGKDLVSGITGDNGSLEVVPDTSTAYSLGRYPDGADSDAAADWHPYALTSPGEANADPGAGGDGPGQHPKTGCGKDSSGAPTEGGCSTVLPLGGMEVGLALLALVRRRRRG
jgi:hypothetical protein